MLLNFGEITLLRKTANKSRFIASEEWGERQCGRKQDVAPTVPHVNSYEFKAFHLRDNKRRFNPVYPVKTVWNGSVQESLQISGHLWDYGMCSLQWRAEAYNAQSLSRPSTQEVTLKMSSGKRSAETNDEVAHRRRCTGKHEHSD